MKKIQDGGEQCVTIWENIPHILTTMHSLSMQLLDQGTISNLLIDLIYINTQMNI